MLTYIYRNTQVFNTTFSPPCSGLPIRVHTASSAQLNPERNRKIIQFNQQITDVVKFSVRRCFMEGIFSVNTLEGLEVKLLLYVFKHGTARHFFVSTSRECEVITLYSVYRYLFTLSNNVIAVTHIVLL